MTLRLVWRSLAILLTGEKAFYGEFLINAQGEDVVAGIRTPQPITKIAAAPTGVKSLEEALPESYQQLVDIYKKLEAHYRDMQDIEFTIERSTLWMLQTRNGKRTAAAALKIACDMIDEKLISEDEAILRLRSASFGSTSASDTGSKSAKNCLGKRPSSFSRGSERSNRFQFGRSGRMEKTRQKSYSCSY